MTASEATPREAGSRPDSPSTRLGDAIAEARASAKRRRAGLRFPWAQRSWDFMVDCGILTPKPDWAYLDMMRSQWVANATAFAASTIVNAAQIVRGRDQATLPGALGQIMGGLPGDHELRDTLGKIVYHAFDERPIAGTAGRGLVRLCLSSVRSCWNAHTEGDVAFAEEELRTACGCLAAILGAREGHRGQEAQWARFMKRRVNRGFAKRPRSTRRVDPADVAKELLRLVDRSGYTRKAARALVRGKWRDVASPSTITAALAAAETQLGWRADR